MVENGSSLSPEYALATQVVVIGGRLELLKHKTFKCVNIMIGRVKCLTWQLPLGQYKNLSRYLAEIRLGYYHWFGFQ